MFSFLKKNPVPQVSVSDLEALGKIELIDIREPHEYKSGHVPNAKNIPMNTLLADPSKYLKADKTYHIICQSGGRSGAATGQLAKKGFQVVNVAGGTGRYPGKLSR